MRTIVQLLHTGLYKILRWDLIQWILTHLDQFNESLHVSVYGINVIWKRKCIKLVLIGPIQQRFSLAFKDI